MRKNYECPYEDISCIKLNTSNLAYLNCRECKYYKSEDKSLESVKTPSTGIITKFNNWREKRYINKLPF